MIPLKSVKPVKLLKWYTDIVSRKDAGPTKDRLILLEPEIDVRYQEYAKLFTADDLVKISDSKYARKDPDLLSCYKSEGVALTELKRIIRLRLPDKAKGTCQYCCLGKPNTFDHYIPISNYPEFAVLAINLVPCCKDCNEIKKAYWKELFSASREQERAIINFYLDDIGSQQFLFANVRFFRTIPHVAFRLGNPGRTIPDVLYRIIERHFKRLNLLERYKNQVNSDFSELIRTLENYLTDTSQNSIKFKLLKDGLELQRDFGINYWRGTYRIALANSSKFISYMEKHLNSL